MAKKRCQQDLEAPRIRFNWGFHDATSDMTRKGYGRVLTETGEQMPHRVTKAFDAAYFEGYRRGVRVTGSRPESSEPAWLSCLEDGDCDPCKMPHARKRR